LSAPNACSIETAVNNAVSGDDVTLLAGPYSTSTMLTAVAGVTVHGTTGAPPLVNSSAPAAFQIQAGSALRDVRIEHTGTSTALFAFGLGSVVERVSAHSSVANITCEAGFGSLIRDTVCWHTGGATADSTALKPYNNGNTGTVTLRNVTAVSTVAPGLVVQTTANTLNVDASGVIAKGVGSDVGRQNLGGTATVTFDHSNYATESDTNDEITNPGTGTNVASPAPVFVDAATGDLHETLGSLGTIDLGSAAAGLGAFDVDGEARTQGDAPDIGADEIDSPVSLPPGPIIETPAPVPGPLPGPNAAPTFDLAAAVKHCKKKFPKGPKRKKCIKRAKALAGA
jgi:hypothetical protein